MNAAKKGRSGEFQVDLFLLQLKNYLSLQRRGILISRQILANGNLKMMPKPQLLPQL